MNEKLKNLQVSLTQNSHFFLSIAICAVLLFVYYFCARGNSDLKQAEVQSSIDSATAAGQSIGDATEQNKSAQLELQRGSDAIGRVSTRIDSSKDKLKSSTDELNELAKLAEECRDRNNQIKSILESAGTASQE